MANWQAKILYYSADLTGSTINVGGVWKIMYDMYVLAGGVWKRAQNVYILTSGRWVKY